MARSPGPSLLLFRDSASRAAATVFSIVGFAQGVAGCAQGVDAGELSGQDASASSFIAGGGPMGSSASTTASSGGTGTGLAGSTGAGGAVGSSGGATGTGGDTDTGGATGTGGTTDNGGAAGMDGTAGEGGAGGVSGNAGTGGGDAGSTDPDLVLWYRFDESAGMTASDSSGSGRVGMLTSVGTGTAELSTMSRVSAGSLNLMSSSATNGGYVNVPASLQTMGATTAMTAAAWVYVRTARQWQRVFDFGNTSATGYAFLTTQTAPRDGAPSAPRFAITMSNNGAEQQINMTTPTALSTGSWHHLAVVLGTGSTYTGTLYVDKVVAGSNVSMTLRPSNLGNTTNNWIGRSQFSADPYADGYVDDFRIYKRALTASEISALP